MARVHTMKNRRTWAFLEQDVLEATRTPRLITLLGILAILLCVAFSGCTNLDVWCDDHPVACPIVATVGSACVAAAVGVIAIKTMHHSSNSSNTSQSPPPPPKVDCTINPALCS